MSLLTRSMGSPSSVPALSRGEGQGRPGTDDVRWFHQRLARLACRLRQPPRRIGRNHSPLPGAGRPGARTRRVHDVPAHAHGTSHAMGRWPLATDGFAHQRPRTGASQLSQRTGAPRHSPDRARLRPSGPSMQGGWPRRPRTHRLRPPDRSPGVESGSANRPMGSPDRVGPATSTPIRRYGRLP